MLKIQVRPDETVIDVLENCMQTRSVRKIWILTSDVTDVPEISRLLTNRDYTVAPTELPGEFTKNNFQNTLVTSWATYAADQDIYRDILSSLDLMVLDGMSELNMGAWHRWAEKARDAGWYLQPHMILITV